jgi:CspA family cold shock protein
LPRRPGILSPEINGPICDTVIFIDVNHLCAHMDSARYYLSTLSPFRRLAFDLVMTPPSCRILRAALSKGDTEMANGTVKWFNTTKGYGFIAPESGGKDVFVHISAVERSGLTGLADDQKVTYDLESGRDGRESAINIALA